MNKVTQLHSHQQPVLNIKNLSVALPAGSDRNLAINKLDLQIKPGEILCLVGESGSGKSVTSSAIMQLLDPQLKIVSGEINLKGINLNDLSAAAKRKIRGSKVAMVFQEPMTALNPLHKIGRQIAEPFTIHTSLSKQQIKAKVLNLLHEVNLPEPEQILNAYPHELSGGQRQRVMIAMALALEPELLICDEPTTALDVTTQKQILKLIRELQQKKGTAVLFITHDFGVVAEIADQVVVLQQGNIVESGPSKNILLAPQHPYTIQLINAIPALDPPAITPTQNSVILSINRLDKTFGKLGLKLARSIKALDQISFDLKRGSSLGIVGESGSGKSTLVRTIVKLINPDSGSITIAGLDSKTRRTAFSKKIQMVFQDPFASLNPRRKVIDLITQGPIAHGVDRFTAERQARTLIQTVGLETSALQRHPHEFSGGQRQRICIARALALEPEILIADEAVSALDVSVQSQILSLFKQLQQELDLSIIFVTHDLRVAAQICEQIIVMKSGQIIESGNTYDVYKNPQSSYTQELLASIPGRDWFNQPQDSRLNQIQKIANVA